MQSTMTRLSPLICYVRKVVPIVIVVHEHAERLSVLDSIGRLASQRFQTDGENSYSFVILIVNIDTSNNHNRF